MNAHTQTNSRKLENMGSKVRRHEHEVKGLPGQGNVLWIQTVPVEHVLNCSQSQQSIFRILLANRLLWQELIIFSREPRPSVVSRINYSR